MNTLKYKRAIVGLVILLIMILMLFALPQLSEWVSGLGERFELAISIVEIAGVVLTIVLTLQQLMDSKEISRATFIMELNQNYVGNAEYMHIYNTLQKRYDDMQSRKYTGEEKREEVFFDKGAVSNYLTFFETIYILKNRGVLSFDIIDDLFAYRFFLAVHSDFFQKSKLGNQPENFKNIYKLEKEWLDYRVRIGKNSRADLDSAYNKFLNTRADRNEPKRPGVHKGATVYWNNVFEARQLRGLVDAKRYKKLIH